MNKTLLILVISLQIFVLISNKDEISLNIYRARAHLDQTGNFIPLVVSLSCPDQQEKMKPVDLICIVDISAVCMEIKLN